MMHPLSALTSLASVSFETHRRTEAVIDCNAFRKNLSFAQAQCPNARMIAVVKADAYGHGILQLAEEALRWGAPMLGVATADEALLLRNSEATKRAEILLMGPSFPESVEELLKARIHVSVGSLELLQAFCKAAEELQLAPRIHLKCETGMGRYGFQPEAVEQAVDLLAARHLPLEGIMTHYAVSDELDEADNDFTKQQTLRFQQICQQVQQVFPKAKSHAGNSGAVLLHPDDSFDFQRPGMMLYGAHPNPVAPRLPLAPVMTLQTQLISTHHHKPGTTISYGRTFAFPSGGTTGILPIGYGDGLPRRLSNNGEVLIRGKRFPIVGRVCMDQTMVDLSSCPEIAVGEACVLIGSQGAETIRLEEVSQRAETIPYEITCQIGRRVPRRYVNRLVDSEL